MSRTKLVTAAALVAVTLSVSSPAGAGEITGNGRETPIKSEQSFPDAPAGPANSLCAFSGLNDDPSEDGHRTQSWGTAVADFKELAGGGAGFGSIVSGMQGPGEFGPGTQCRGLPVNPLSPG